jgi:hypothetical protein
MHTSSLTHPRPVRTEIAVLNAARESDLHTYAVDVRDLLGLDRWDISIVWHDAPPNDDGEMGLWHGDCLHSQRTMTAQIRLRKELPAREARRAIFHELLHVRLGLMQQAAERMVELLPDGLRPHAWTLFEDALERTVEELTRALHAGITPPETT